MLSDRVVGSAWKGNDQPGAESAAWPRTARAGRTEDGAGMSPRAVRQTNPIKSRTCVGLLTAGAVLGYLVFASAVLRPWHAAGWGQSVLEPFICAASILEAPGRLTLLGLHVPCRGPSLVLAVPVNALTYFAFGIVARGVWRWLAGRRGRAAGGASPSEATAAADQRRARRQFLAAGVKTLVGGTVAGAGYAAVLAPQTPEVTHRTIRLRGLPRGLDGLRAVQVTDVHHGPWLARDRVRRVVDQVNELRPDLVLLTGDYVDQSPEYIAPVADELARLRPLIGMVAVLGNHDWYEGAEQCRREFARLGIPLIDNGRLVLTPERRLVKDAADGLALCGVGDFQEGRQDYVAALGGLPEGMPRVLLAHNPDIAEEPGLVKGGLRVDLMVSGHTHGGQICLPLVGAPITMSRYGQKYRQGLVEGPVCPVFICRGIGVTGLPVRVGVKPEVAVLEFRSDAGGC